MQNAAFAAHGIDATYELRPTVDEEVPDFFVEARGPEWLGFGVTAPYKELAVAHLDIVEPGATAIGAVNNGLRRDDGTLVGFNTDAPGFMSAVDATGTEVADRPAVVVGAGGAARAVVWALLDAGAGPIHVANRTVERARALAADLRAFGEVSVGPTDDEDLPGRLAAAAIAVNATTQGMSTDTVAFDVTPLQPGCLVFDLVYVPPQTPLLHAAAERGLVVSNGLEMLVRQGEIAFERWTGIAGTADVMRDALTKWLTDTAGDVS
jgi:shikimate dehydrogenase